MNQERRSAGGIKRVVWAVPVAVVLAATLAACGGSKAAYCSDRDTLEASVKALPGFVTSVDLAGLRDQVMKVQSDANTLVESAKDDFPSETQAIATSVSAARSSIESLPSSPSAGEIGRVGIQAATAVSAVQRFSKAASSKCE